MAQVFISYSSADEQYAVRLFRYLKANGIAAWFAPANIGAGNNYAEEIGQALDWDQIKNEDDVLERRVEVLDGAQVIVLLLSRNSMQSVWVKKEIKMAANANKMIIPLQIDHAPLTPEYKYLLVDVQIISAYHLPVSALDAARERLLPVISAEAAELVASEQIPSHELGIDSIAMGDPYYVNGETLTCSLTRHSFYLAPPAGSVPEEAAQWTAEHFVAADQVFDQSWDRVCAEIPIDDLRQRIESSRRKIYAQFVNQENGCYYNNKKYGVYSIRPFGRTEDLSEVPVLEIQLYTTDYFTHRVMKDVCKQLVQEKNSHLTRGLKYAQLGANRIFFTSLGVNLLLLDSGYLDQPCTLLTSRSVNAAETYDRQRYSASVIEGVSLSDYDPYLKSVNMTLAVLRGLDEELGVASHLLRLDTLHFYELFLNRANLEMGLSCSIELDKNLSIRENVLSSHGKDELIEIAEKKVVPLDELIPFVLLNRQRFLPQAVFTICSYFEALGRPLLDRQSGVAAEEESFCLAKDGSAGQCGDAVYQGEHFLAVIDGATTHASRRWQGLPGDIFAARCLLAALDQLDPQSTAQAAIAFLNRQLAAAYQEAGLDFADLGAEERLGASIIIYSQARREVWSFGDCRMRLNAENYDHTPKVDTLLAGLRAFVTEVEQAKAPGLPLAPDFGRRRILPYLQMQPLLANTAGSFGYPVINGGKIDASQVKVYPVQKGDHVVLASDGYPKLFDTLAECEDYLARALQKDRACLYVLRGTKGVAEGNFSYDDRAFLSFCVR